MKAKFLWIAGAAMIASLASCSKDVTTDADDGGFAPENANVAYAKLDIRLGGPGTRANREYDDLKSDEGTANERAVKNVTLAIYDKDNKLVGHGSTTIGASTPSTGNVSDKYNTDIVKLEMIGKKTENMKVVAYVNTTAADLLDFDDAMLSTTDAIGNENDGLTMTNSGYFAKEEGELITSQQGSKITYSDWTVATPIDADSFYSSEEAAKEGTGSTTIYVERLAAKVSVKLGTGASVNTADVDVFKFASVASDAEPAKVALKFDADNAKWAASGTAKQMYWLKNAWPEDLHVVTKQDHIENDTPVYWQDPWTIKANDKDNYRSYWAKGVYYEAEYPDLQKKHLNYVSYKDLKEGGAKSKAFGGYDYIPEHTYGEKVIGYDKSATYQNYNEIGAATGVMALGQYEVYDLTNGSIPSGASALADYKNGFYLLLDKKGDGEGVKDKYTIFTEAELKLYIAEYTTGGKPFYWGSSAPTSTSGSSYVTPADASSLFDLVWLSDEGKYTIQMKAANSNISCWVADEVEEGAAQTYTEYKFQEGDAAKSNAKHYNDACAYFFKPIQHLAESGIGHYGVVRNHSYNLTVTSFSNLGTPLDDDHVGDNEEDPIVPDPDVVALIRAELNVLSWNKVEQEVAW